MVFNIKANGYRLIASVQYVDGVLMIRFLGSHEEYDGPKMVTPQAKREGVRILMSEHDFGVTRACGLVRISRSLFRYCRRRADQEGLHERIEEIAALKRRYGYRRVYLRCNLLMQWRFKKSTELNTVGNTVRFSPMRESSGEPLFRNLRLLMLESRVKGLQLLDGHSHRNIPRNLSPLRNRTMYFAQNF